MRIHTTGEPLSPNDPVLKMLKKKALEFMERKRERERLEKGESESSDEQKEG